MYSHSAVTGYPAVVIARPTCLLRQAPEYNAEHIGPDTEASLAEECDPRQHCLVWQSVDYHRTCCHPLGLMVVVAVVVSRDNCCSPADIATATIVDWHGVMTVSKEADSQCLCLDSTG